jgi:MFS transporter, DHA2 family, methylenomycin A resistance protein
MRWLTVTVTSLGLFLAVLSTTLVSVALPTIGRQLHAGPDALEWTVDAYVLVYACLLIPGGSLGDRYGRKRLFLIGLALFGLGCLGAGLAHSVPVLLASRVVQGLGPALLVPASLAIVRTVFDDERRRAVAIGVWSTSSGLALAVGPPLGGLLVDGLGWRWVFLANVPLSLALLALALFVVPVSERTPGDGPIDVVGAALATAAVGLLALGAIAGLYAAFAGSLLAAIAFGYWELRHPRPLVDLRLFANRRFTGANVAAFVVFFAFIGLIVYLSAYFQQVRGDSAIQAGLHVAPIGVACALAAVAAGRLVGRYGERWPLVVGLALAGAATLGLLFARSWWVLALAGAGIGLCGTPISTAAMSTVDKARAGMASAVVNAMRQTGQVIGVAVLGWLVFSRQGTVTRAGLDRALVLSGVVLLVTAVAIAQLFRSSRRADEAGTGAPARPLPRE